MRESVLDRAIAARRDDKTNATERRISIGGDDDAVRGAARDECELAIDDRIIDREVRREVHGEDRREIHGVDRADVAIDEIDGRADDDCEADNSTLRNAGTKL